MISPKDEPVTTLILVCLYKNFQGEIQDLDKNKTLHIGNDIKQFEDTSMHDPTI